MCDDPPAYLDRFRKSAGAAIERGAGAFLMAGNPLNIILAGQILSDVDGVPVVDGLAATVKTAEMLVDLKAAGIERSRAGLFAAPGDEDLAKLRALYE